MVKITAELRKTIAEASRNFRMTDDDCMSDEEFEEWAGCKRASREEIEKRNREHRKSKKKK